LPLFNRVRNWRQQVHIWMLYALFFILFSISIVTLIVITQTNNNSIKNSKSFFESSIWNALQLQAQHFRFQNYLLQLGDKKTPISGQTFDEYDLLMSRIDLLRKGVSGVLIRNFENGRPIRLLNIINGELELLSLPISKLEEGNLAYLPDLISRLDALSPQINDFIILVNKGRQAYMTNQYKEFESSLNNIQTMTIALIASLLTLCFFTFKVLSKLKGATENASHLQTSITELHTEKSELLSFLHQELHPPINAILSAAQSLKSSNEEQKVEELSSYITESTHQLLNTINMLSDLSLIDANTLKLSSKTSILAREIESCITPLISQFESKDITSIVYIDPILPEIVRLDFERMQEIIVPLLQNAITYTQKGSISIQVRPSSLTVSNTVLMDAPPTQMLQIAIKDTGIGMPDSLQKQLRIPSKLASKESHLHPSIVGLGLALCYKLVNLMGGEVHFSSSSQTGTEFWVDIPFQIPNNTKSIEKNTVTNISTKNALLIERDSNLTKVLSSMLAGFNVQLTQVEAIETQQPNYDLLILGDTKSLDNDQIQVLREWQSNGIPVLCYNQDSRIEGQLLTLPLNQHQVKQYLVDLLGVKPQ